MPSYPDNGHPGKKSLGNIQMNMPRNDMVRVSQGVLSVAFSSHGQDVVAFEGLLRYLVVISTRLWYQQKRR